MIEITELPRFFETQCVFCGARLRYQFEDLKGNLQFSCPNCGNLVEHEVENAVFEDEKEKENKEEMMNLPEDLSEEEYAAILEAFDRTITRANRYGNVIFSCPLLSCEKCPMRDVCQNAYVYDEKTWKELKEAWEKEYV